ncbi:MAG: CHASE2 domain-containing protein, partial [Phycisphaerae bacterium]
MARSGLGPEAYLQDRPVLRVRQRRLIWLMAPVILALLCGYLSYSGRLDRYELDSIDDRFVRRGPLKPDGRVVVVEIDEKSRRELRIEGVQFNIRRHLDDAIEALADAGAVVIGVDVFLEGRGDAEVDARLAEVIAEANVVLATGYVDSKNHRPAELFRRAGAEEGQINVTPDADGVLRRVPAHPNRGMIDVAGVEVEQFVHFPFVLAWMVLSEEAYEADREPEPADFSDSEQVTMMGRTVRYGYPVNFAAGPGQGFVTLSLADAARRRFDPALVDGAAVLIGDARAIVDQFQMPLSSRRWPGVYYHANVVDQILQDRPLVDWPGGRLASAWVAAAMAALCGWYFWNLRDWWRHRVGWMLLGLYFAVGLAFGGGGWWYACHAAFARGTVLPMAGPLVGVGSAFVGALAVQAGVMAVSARRLSQRNRQIETLFGRSVSAQMLEAIKSDPGRIARTELREATVLFCDIRGFTATSGKLSPEQVAGMLNEYFSAITSAVFENHGFVDKFVGDELMAVFGVPLEQSDHVERAAYCALGIKRELGDLNERRALRGDGPLDCGVGIHTGQVAAGHIGTAERANYTVVGDTVNMAARIEGLTAGGEVLVSEEVQRCLDGKIPSRSWKTVQLRGSDRQHRLFELTLNGLIKTAALARAPNIVERSG